jgi:hypothetical protein
MGSHSQAITYAAFYVVFRLLQYLATPRISGNPEDRGVPGSPNNSLAAWVTFAGAAVPWRMPTAASTRMARTLAERLIAEASDEVEDMIAKGTIKEMGHAARRRVRRAQLLAYVTCTALTDVLRPLCLAPGVAEAKGSGGPGSLCICALHFPGWEGFTGVEQALSLALRIAQHANPANVLCMNMVIATIEVCFHSHSSAHHFGACGQDLAHDCSSSSCLVNGVINAVCPTSCLCHLHGAHR